VTDWAPLADRDPIPGDPNGVVSLARRLSADADSMRTQLQRLEAVNSDEFWCGEAAEAFRQHQKELPELLNHVVTRFERVSAALSSYGPGLGEAQSQARTALARAKEAQADIDSARAGIDQLHRQAEEARKAADDWTNAHPGEPAPPAETWASPNYNARLDQAEAELKAARRMLDDAKQIRDDAAHRCAETVGDASHDDLKNDTGLFHRIGHAVSTFVEKAAPIVGVVAGVIGVAAIFFPLLAPFALGVGAVALILDGYKATETGEGWGVVALDAVALATFGVGRAFGSVAKGVEAVSEAEKGAQALKATTGVKGALTGLRETSASGNILTGAAARSAKVARLEGTVEDFNQASKLKYLPKASQWRSAFSPAGIKGDLVGRLHTIGEEGVRALPNSFRELRVEGGLARGAWGGSRLDNTVLVLHDVRIGVETAGGVAAGKAGAIAAHDLLGGHHDEGGHHGAESGET
jgi:uncharacterized protein YukE